MKKFFYLIITIIIVAFNFSFSTEFSGAYINHPDPLIRQIDTLFEKGKFSEAKVIINKILSNPENYTSEEIAFAHLRQGLLYKYEGDFDNAIIHYQKVIEISPNAKIANDAKTHLATVYFYLGRLNEAEELLQEVLENTDDERQIKFCNYWLRYIRKIKEYQSSFGPVNYQ